jgi:hypothetical protein
MCNEIQIPEGLVIEENYDDPLDKEKHEKFNFLCYKMFCGNQVLCVALYKLKEDLWYLEEFDAKLTDSQPGQGYGTLFLKFLVKNMLAEKQTKIYAAVSSGLLSKSGDYFVEWLTKRGFEQDQGILPGYTSIYSLRPENISKLFGYKPS